MSHWNEPKLKFNRHPRGLSGRDIGLYYRNQSLKQGRREHEHLINLTIPPPVVTTLYNHLKEIEITGKSLNIELKPFSKPHSKITQGKDSGRKEIENVASLKRKEVLSKTDETSSADCKPVSAINHDGTKIGSHEFASLSPRESEKEKPLDEAAGPSGHKSTKKEPLGGDYSNCFETPGPSSYTGCKQSHNITIKGAGDYKYGYEDIITGTFDEKLEMSLAENEPINKSTKEIDNLSITLRENYNNMLLKGHYIKMMKFRQQLPTYKMSKELLEVINNNQVVVISGETGCGKSTQVPQLILDHAIVNKRGANIKILVTQPRRIAASSLAMRIADERAESLGNSVGYAVRLEKKEPKKRGSIMFCTTGILLADLEVNQGLTGYSHVILDEVHERDSDIDIAMCMLKKVLKKRTDLKLILMSATIDANTLSAYFNNCPMVHIEGLAYPVEDLYLEDVLEMTGYQLPPPKCQTRNKNMSKPWYKHTRKGKNQASEDMEKDIKYNAEISKWLEPMKKKLSPGVYNVLRDRRIEELNVDLIFELLKCICRGEPGAILVFLPGIGDITKLLRIMQDSGSFPRSFYEVYPLHSKLPSLEQHKIFKSPPGNIRKIIIATNIAETSITIDDIVYVIDCGKIKYSGLNVEQNVSTLATEWISQANMRQRRGRAGRCQPGICYHLLTSHRAKNLEERLLPELQRSNLLEAVLTIKKMRLGKATDALGLMAAPPAEATIASAVKHLHQLGALDETETLTPLGWHLARLPVHPAAGKLLLLGALFNCIDRAASVAAVWGFKDPFMLVIGKEREVDAVKRDFAIGEPSDHIAISEAIIQWEQCSSHNKRLFANENFLSMNTLELLSEMKKQLGNNLKQMGFLQNDNLKAPLKNKNGNNLSLFKAIVAASLYPNVGIVRWINLNSIRPNRQIRIKVSTPEDGNVAIHPSSVMEIKGGYRGQPVCDNPGANWLVYWLKQRSSDLFLIDVSLVYTLPLMFFGEMKVSEVKDTNEDTEHCLISISTKKVKCRKDTTELLILLKSLLDRVLAAKITMSVDESQNQALFDEQVLNAVIQIITAEDERVEYLSDEDTSESDHHDRNHHQSSKQRRHH